MYVVFQTELCRNVSSLAIKLIMSNIVSHYHLCAHAFRIISVLTHHFTDPVAACLAKCASRLDLESRVCNVFVISRRKILFLVKRPIGAVHHHIAPPKCDAKSLVEQFCACHCLGRRCRHLQGSVCIQWHAVRQRGRLLVGLLLVSLRLVELWRYCRAYRQSFGSELCFRGNCSPRLDIFIGLRCDFNSN